MKLKKMIPLLLALSVAVSASACGNNKREAASDEKSIITDSEETTPNEESDEDSETSYQGSETSVQESDPVEENIRCSDQNHKYAYDLEQFSPETLSELNSKLTSSYVVLYDSTEDKVLYSYNGEERCYPASTTKLLTAITACKIFTDPQTVITVGDEVYKIDPESSKAGLEPGMQLTFEMLMDAMLLPSGNDAAYVMAVSAGRKYKNDETLSAEMAIDAFMELENKIASNIGTTRTNYVTPDGIHSEDHFTNARDLAVIADYARTIPLIKNSCAKPEAEWTFVTGESTWWKNTNYILDIESMRYSPFCNGMKTGFTDQAGNSLIASATVEDHTLIAVMMNARSALSRFDDCNFIFEKGFELYGLEYTYNNKGNI